jgi:tRNA-dihydrouridine synthase
VLEMRKNLMWYVKGLPGAAAFRRQVVLLAERAQVEEAVRKYFGELVR